MSTSNGWSFGYDANGNMNSYKGSSISWTSYNLPNVINSAGQASQFFYGPNRNRWKQVATYPSGTETTIYVGGILEKVTAPSGTAYRHTIGAGSVKVLYTRWSTGTLTTKYVTADHLGSSTLVMNDSGTTLVNLSFGSYGARRGSAWTGTPTSGDWTQIANSTRRGFTGHEHLDNVNFVHMNGRVFEPVLGRFISADPFMPGSLGSQAPNRYAYVGNRPQSLVDPSGYFPRAGNALKQWLDGPGALDALELAINRSWLAWGGVRNVSDGLEGTHAGLLAHAWDIFNPAGGNSISTLAVLAASGSAGSTAVAMTYAAADARSASLAAAACTGCLPTVTVTAPRVGVGERISWSPGRAAPSGTGLGGTGSMTMGMRTVGTGMASSRNENQAGNVGESYWGTAPVQLQGMAVSAGAAGGAGYFYGLVEGIRNLQATSAALRTAQTINGYRAFGLLVALKEVGGLPLVYGTAAAGTGGALIGGSFALGWTGGAILYNQFDLEIAGFVDAMAGY